MGSETGSGTIVLDTSALITIASIDCLDHVLAEYDIHTTETVRQELEETTPFEDVHGDAAGTVLARSEAMETHDTGRTDVRSSRIDAGEGSTVTLANDIKADFLITDDLRALPELQAIVDCSVAISPIMLRALVKRGVLDRDEALDKLEEAAVNRDWLESPIYKRARELFE